jgi:hypothetical protein
LFAWTARENLRLLAQEFVHVAQYERLGREGFLQQYIQQIAAHGYPNAPFEQEAEAEDTRWETPAGASSAFGVLTLLPIEKLL